MELKPIDSEDVEAVGYDPQSKRMRVKLRKNGLLYDFADVFPEGHTAFVDAISAGRKAPESFRYKMLTKVPEKKQPTGE